MYSVRLLEPAAEQLSRLNKPIARRIVRRLRWLAENLDRIKPEPLTGEFSGLYKLRSGDYRVIYEPIRDEEAVVVHRVGHRRDIYRRR